MNGRYTARNTSQSITMLTRHQHNLVRELYLNDLVLTRHANRASRPKFGPTPKRNRIGDKTPDEMYARAWSILPRLIRAARNGRRQADAGYIAGVIQGLAIGMD